MSTRPPPPPFDLRRYTRLSIVGGILVVMVAAQQLFAPGAFARAYWFRLAFFAITLTLLAHTIWSHFHPPKPPSPNRCTGCGYDLTGLDPATRCPECARRPGDGP